MTKTVTIPLAEPFQAHKERVSRIVLREPRYEDVMGVGAPYTIHTTAEGKPFVVYDEAAIKHYAAACLVDVDPLIVESEVGLVDTLAIREAVVGFFLDAAVGAGGSRTSPTPSSSAGGGSPTPSAG